MSGSALREGAAFDERELVVGDERSASCSESTNAALADRLRLRAPERTACSSEPHWTHEADPVWRRRRRTTRSRGGRRRRRAGDAPSIAVKKALRAWRWCSRAWRRTRRDSWSTGRRARPSWAEVSAGRSVVNCWLAGSVVEEQAGSGSRRRCAATRMPAAISSRRSPLSAAASNPLRICTLPVRSRPSVAVDERAGGGAVVPADVRRLVGADVGGADVRDLGRVDRRPRPGPARRRRARARRPSRWPHRGRRVWRCVVRGPSRIPVYLGLRLQGRARRYRGARRRVPRYECIRSGDPIRREFSG